MSRGLVVFFLTVMLITISIDGIASTTVSKPAFPTKIQRTDIAEALLTGIETLDAVTIQLRNDSRDVSWKQLRAKVKSKIVSATTWNSLYRAIDNLHYGVINKHAFVVVEKSISKQLKPLKYWPRFSLGYTWPNINFYSLDNMKDIHSINGKSIRSVFDDYYNVYCNDAHESGCLASFSQFMSKGYFFLGGENKLAILYRDGSQDVIEHANNPRKVQAYGPLCENNYDKLEVEIVFAGEQSCLYQSKDAYLLKIAYFGNWGASDDDVYCLNPSTKGMCTDINSVKEITRNAPTKPLVIDIQNNGGGSDNTPWVAALTNNGFKDNLVLYKNLTLLEDEKLRQSAFYHSDRAEQWYQHNKHKVTAKDEFLPVRADFCRGSTRCEHKIIPSARYPILYSSIRLVVNKGCVSSCDDLVWRLREYAQAKTYGQHPATDGAYARLKGYVLMTSDGQIETQIMGDNVAPNLEGRVLLVSYQMPIARTVTSKLELLEGEESVLDFPVSVTKDNFGNLAVENVARALRF